MFNSVKAYYSAHRLSELWQTDDGALQPWRQQQDELLR